MNPPLRKRSSNFVKEEELLLLAEIAKHQSTIESKTTNGAAVTEKNNAWKMVLACFNAKNSQQRSLEQIKGKFDNLKTKTRKWVLDNKTAKNVWTDPDPVIKAVLSIINYKKDPISLDYTAPIAIEVKDTNTRLATEVEEIMIDVKCEQDFDLNSEFLTENYSSDEELGPKTPNSAFIAKEQYYRKKTELLQLQIDEIKRKRVFEDSQIEEEKIRKKKSAAREEEKHRKEILLLNLKIEREKCQNKKYIVY